MELPTTGLAPAPTPAQQRTARIHAAIDELETRLREVCVTSLKEVGNDAGTSGSQFLDSLDSAAARLENVLARLAL